MMTFTLATSCLITSNLPWFMDLTFQVLRDQPWDFFGRNDAKAETPVLWPPHAKSWLTGKDSVAGRDWGQQEKGTTEDELAGWHHWLDGRESEWTPGVGVGQGGLACCNSWGRKESDTTEQLFWSDLIWFNIALYRIEPCFHHQSHSQLGVVFALVHPFILSGVISLLISSSISVTYQPGEFIFQCPIFLSFHTVHGVLKARMLKWFAIPFSSGPHSVRPIHHIQLLGWLHMAWLSFTELDKSVVHVIR